MPTTTRASSGAIVASIGLSLLAILIWAVQLATLSNLSSSDAAGNAIAQPLGALEIILLWALLAVLMILAIVKGAMPRLSAIVGLILIPASGFAAMTAADLLALPQVSPFTWPILVPALVPPLVVAFCFWALVPPLRAAVPARLAGGITWGATLILCVAVALMVHMRSLVIEQEDTQRAKWDADFASLPANSALWAWTPFLTTPNETKKGAVLDSIRRLDRRQSDAEIMLDRGDFPLLYLGSFDLDPTPAICDTARNLLRRRVAPLALKTSNSKPYADIADAVEGALAAMKWLVGYDCSCDAESRAWESMANAYRDRGFDVVELAQLRDPKNLGRTLREYPARFSMLTPKAHLKAWLRFVDDKDLRQQALAGARKLDHRTADAVEMLDENEYAAWDLLRYLPVLELEATAPLCEAAQKVLHGEFMKIYRPASDDPRPYQELLERMGTGEPLPALQWLASHGCDAEAELSEAEALVRAYQDSPDRAAVLATLAQLHRKP